METLLAQIMSDLKIIKNSDNYRSPIFNPVEYAKHAFNKCLDLQQKLQDENIKGIGFEYFNDKQVRASYLVDGVLTPIPDGRLWDVKVEFDRIKLRSRSGIEFLHLYWIKDFKIVAINGEIAIQNKHSSWYFKICTE